MEDFAELRTAMDMVGLSSKAVVSVRRVGDKRGGRELNT